MSVKTRWFKGMPTKDKERFRKELKASISVLERLSEIMKDDLMKSHADSGSVANYSMPAWSQYQAHKLGEQATLLKLIDFVNIEDK